MSTPTTPTGSPQPGDAASWKRKYELLDAMYKEPNANVTARQITLGRSLRRTIDLFHSARDLVEENERRMRLEEDGEDVGLSEDEKHMIRSYEELVKCIPLLKDLMEQGDAESLDVLYKNLRKGSDMARGDDTSHLKAAVIGWISDMFGASNPPLKVRSKDERGFANEHTGRLLCPSEYSWNDPTVRAGIRDGHNNYCVTASSWPMFVYAGLTCDQDNLEKGLFKGSLLVKAYKSIFTSPSSVTADMGNDGDEPPPSKHSRNLTATRSNVASLIGLNTVTLRSIAYVAVQVRFALSSGNSWRPTDIDFDYAEFYQAVVDYFEVTPGPVAKVHVAELLAWWNRAIFGRTTGHGSAAARRKDSSVSKLAAQRRAREA